MSPLQNLEILILSYNNIKSIGFSFVALKKLQHLDLGFNLLEVNDGSLIKTLKFNPELISLVLSGNIDYNFETCKYICLEYLHKLDFLDNFGEKFICFEGIKFFVYPWCINIIVYY